jgi:hypothetical protein
LILQQWKDALRRLLGGAKSDLGDGITIEPFNVLSLVDAIAEALKLAGVPGPSHLRESYDLASEWAHPNAGGTSVDWHGGMPQPNDVVIDAQWITLGSSITGFQRLTGTAGPRVVVSTGPHPPGLTGRGAGLAGSFGSLTVELLAIDQARPPASHPGHQEVALTPFAASSVTYTKIRYSATQYIPVRERVEGAQRRESKGQRSVQRTGDTQEEAACPRSICGRAQTCVSRGRIRVR